MTPPLSLADRTLALCRIPSVTADEKAIADHVEAWAHARFPAEQVYRHSHSLVVGKRVDPRPTVVLFGHVDTVPLHPKSAPARIEGDRLFGLGASDMKGAVAVMMKLAEELPLATLPANVLFIFYEREEGSFAEGGLGPLLELVPELSKAAFAIALEPTDGAVQVGCVGTLHAQLVFEGKSAHSARPWQGLNAISLAGPVLAELHQMKRREVNASGYTYYEVMSPTVASGGRARNVIPERFEVNVNYRFAPGKSVEQAKADVLAFVAGRARVTFADVSPSGHVCADSPWFQRLLALSGKPAEPKQAWTDVARFSAVGVDAVNFGPGETAQAHQQDESCSVKALDQGYALLHAFLTAKT